MLRHRPAPVKDEPLRVDEVYPLARLVFRQALQPEEALQLHPNADPSGARAQEQYPVVRKGTAGRRARELRSVDEPAQHDRARALDIVVEQRVLLAEALQVPKRLVRREVLELNQALRERRGHLAHELVHELVHDGHRHALLAEAEVERIVEVALRVGAEVEADGQGGLGADARAGDVERELADRDGHAVHAEVAQAEDARAVGHDGDARLVLARPVAQDLPDLALVFDGDELRHEGLSEAKHNR